MRVQVAVLFLAFIAFIHSRECNGKLSSATRITMSVVRIMIKDDRIQTGAYSNIRGKIFVLMTDDIDRRTAFLKNVDTTTFWNKAFPCEIKAYDGMEDNVFIIGRTDDGSHIITLSTGRDFEHFPMSDDLKPLPFGKEDKDDVAQLAGWTTSEWQITIPVTIQKDEDKTYIHVLLEPFIENRKKIREHYEMKVGDLLFQSNRIIGFLRNIDTDRKLIIFHRAVSIISTDREYFDLGSDDESSTSSHAPFSFTCSFIEK